MSLNDFDDAIVPEGFNTETGTLSDLESTSQVESAPTTEQITESKSTEVQGQAEQSNETTISQQEVLEQLTEPAIPQTIKVKFNHEEKELSFDEAAQYAQKGMNYDKLEEKLKALEAGNTEALRLAKQLGYESITEMHKAAATNLRTRKIRELVEAGNTQAMAEFLVDQELAKAAPPVIEQQPVQQAQPKPEEQSKPAISDQRKAELDEFIKAYPGVTKLPKEVIEANRNGVRLLVAYERFQNSATQKELQILKQNQAAAAKAPVTGVTGKSATEVASADDPFLRGFDSAY